MRYFRSSRTENQIKEIIEKGIPIVVFDTETTGIEDDAKIIQLAAKKIRFNKKLEAEVLGEFNTFINPIMPLPGKITEITHITDADLEDAPVEDDVIDEIEAFFGEKPCIAAYNIEFDIKKMHYMYKRCGREFKASACFDVIDMVRDMEKRLEPFDKSKPAYNLGNVLASFQLDKGLDFHKADEDVKGTIRIMQTCVKYYYQNPNVEGFNTLRVMSVNYPEYKKFTPSHKDVSLYIATDKGLVYFNTFYKYFASNDVDLRFYNIRQLEDDVCRITGTTPHTLNKFKRKAVA